MSRALGEEVTWDDHNVTSIDWRTYHSLPLGFAVPKIEVVLLNRPDVPATGAGETAITVVAGAIGNAIFDATGARIRQVPFTPERIKAALPADGASWRGAVMHLFWDVPESLIVVAVTKRHLRKLLSRQGHNLSLIRIRLKLVVRSVNMKRILEFRLLLILGYFSRGWPLSA